MQTGLFTRQDLAKGRPARPGRAADLPLETLHALECKVCPRNNGADAQSPKMLAAGSENPTYYVLLGTVDRATDSRGESGAGKTRALLGKVFTRAELRDDVRVNHVVRTFDTRSETTKMATECCRPSVVRDIERSKPRVILGLGPEPLAWMLGSFNIALYRGRPHPVRVGQHVCWFVPVADAEYIEEQIERNRKGDPVLREDALRIFSRDVDYGRSLVETPADQYYQADGYFDKVEAVLEPERAAELLAWCRSAKVLAFDIETTALRPYKDNGTAKQGQILTAAVSVPGYTFSFPLDHAECDWREMDRIAVWEAFCDLLQHCPSKVAHNALFELEWLGYHVPSLLDAPGWHDTMQQAYVLDERVGGHSLNFLTRQYFGFGIKSLVPVNTQRLDDTSSSTIFSDAEPLDKLLRYNALDAKYTLALFRRQNAVLKERGLSGVYGMQVARVVPTVKAQLSGLSVDLGYVKTFAGSVRRQIEDAEASLQKFPSVGEYTARFGAFEPSNPGHQLKLFRDILHRSEVQRDDGSYSADKAARANIDAPEARLISKIVELYKLESTYITPLGVDAKRTVVWSDGKVHCHFNLASTATGRLSSDSPNMQNIPIRSKVGKEVRRCFVPEPGNVLVKSDYGQIEARCIGMVSKDEALCNALWTSYDIHLAWAERLAQLAPGTLAAAGDIKTLRSEVKNKLVFPLFFGSHCASVGRQLHIGKDVASKIADEFWDEFAGVRDMQKLLVEQYVEHGFVEYLTGRRRHAPLTFNQIINSPIQGLATEIIMDAMARLCKKAKQEDKHWLVPRLQIHDDLTFVVPEHKLDEALADIVAEMLAPSFSWINVPLQVELSVGSNWRDVEEVGRYSSNDVPR